MWLNEDTVSTLQKFLCTTNLQDVVFLAKFSFILRGMIVLVAALLRCGPPLDSKHLRG